MQDELEFHLQFERGELSYWVDRYLKHLKANEVELEEEIEKRVAPRIQKEGYLNKEDFRKMCKWKGIEGEDAWIICQRNDEAFIKVVSKNAFANSNERFRVSVFGLLQGVDWSMASVFLHFGHPDPYPVVDAITLRAMGIYDETRIDYDLWYAFTDFCRKLSKDWDVDMRTLDRAFRQFGKENTKPPKKKKKK